MEGGRRMKTKLGERSWKGPWGGEFPVLSGRGRKESGRTAKDLGKSKSLKWAYRPIRFQQNDPTPQAASHLNPRSVSDVNPAVGRLAS